MRSSTRTRRSRANTGRRLYAPFHAQPGEPVQPGGKLVFESSFCRTTTRRYCRHFRLCWPEGSSNAPFTTLGGNDQTYTQGRKVTQWQINDNLIWTRGRHSFKFGENSRRLDVSDYDLGEGVVPEAVYNDLAQFTYGAASTVTAAFPVTQKERIAVGNLDIYAMDTYKLSQLWTVHRRAARNWNTNR
jgi:hypothetical protein